MQKGNHALLGNPETTAAFTGYRPHKLPQFCSTETQAELSRMLKRTITDSYAKGYRIFIHGMMAGWDVLAAEAVLELRSDLAGLCCISVAPFMRKYFANSNWTPEWKARALQVYKQSDYAFALSEKYQSGTYHTRNEYLVDHASLLIAYYDGKPGGTQYTCSYAKNKGLNIINIATEYCSKQ